MAVAKPISPPGRKILCQVCGAWSSGLHFGVFTCEGCKCFYRRSIREGANYACAKDRGCEITMETRNSCRYCRFNKCLTLGMSKEGIKLGRRPKVECEPAMHNGYFRHDVPSKPSVAPNPGIPYQHWPHMGPISNTSTIQIKAEMNGDCGIYSSTTPPYRPGFTIKKEPGETEYSGRYQCPITGHTNSPHFRASIGTHKPGQWSDQTRWKSEDIRGQYGDPYVGNTTRVAHSQPAAAWTPVRDSPDSSGRLYADHMQWQDTGKTPTPLNIPEVQTGAIAAMAFANLYRDKTVVADQSTAATTIAPQNGDSNNNSQEESHVADKKSYIELMPRGRSEKRLPEPDSSDMANVKHRFNTTPQCNMTQLLSPEVFEDSESRVSSSENHGISMKRSLPADGDTLPTKNLRQIKDEDETGTSEPPSITDIVSELTASYTKMQSDVLRLYRSSQNDSLGVAHGPTFQSNRFPGSNEMSENFCLKKKDELKPIIQNFVSFLKAQNPSWIPGDGSDQIPIAFITKICLLAEYSRLPERHVKEHDISPEEAACLVTLSLIYDKRSAKESKDTNSEKRQLANDIREELKKKGFGSHKLQRLLEQQELNMPNIKTG